jgi:hypothetical protein
MPAEPTSKELDGYARNSFANLAGDNPCCERRKTYPVNDESQDKRGAMHAGTFCGTRFE